MKLTFAVQQGGAVVEITISLSVGSCATPFDLADMSDEIKLALAPQLAQLSERMSAASIETIKQAALDKTASPPFRLTEATRVYRLTGEVLNLEDPDLQARLQERINRLQVRGAQAS